VKPGDRNCPPEIVRGAERVGLGMGDDLVEKRLLAMLAAILAAPILGSPDDSFKIVR
jgi:hypothetical protein